jgi:hypothetical protein
VITGGNRLLELGFGRGVKSITTGISSLEPSCGGGKSVEVRNPKTPSATREQANKLRLGVRVADYPQRADNIGNNWVIQESANAEHVDRDSPGGKRVNERSLVMALSDQDCSRRALIPLGKLVD